MAYSKCTIITGHKQGYIEPTAEPMTEERFAQVERNKPYNFSVALSGHWKAETALRYARRHGCVGEVKMAHYTNDMSGRGRGGKDSAIVIS